MIEFTVMITIRKTNTPIQTLIKIVEVKSSLLKQQRQKRKALNLQYILQSISISLQI